jgi:Glutamate synthase domain 1
MMMLMPQAWGKKHYLGRDVRGFFEYESMLMEPWDGPAAVAFSDGVNAGAILDRNGLRPARYTLCKDGLFVMASETGVLDLRDDEVEEKGRLKPGEIIYLDLENHRILKNAEMKAQVARSKPYRRWVAEN